MFEDEKRKLEQRKKSIGQVEISKDKLHSAVRSGFEKAKKEQTLKRTKIIKRSSWSIVIAAILLISFVTSISVSTVFANKIASIPGMERIVALIQQDRGLTAAVENDFYQPLNLSQEKNGIKVTLDGVIADKKGMVIFYSVRTEDIDVSSLELKYLQLWSGMNTRYGLELMNYVFPLTPKSDSKVFSGSEHIQTVPYSKDLSWKIGLKNGEKIEHFKIPFTYKKMNVESKNILVNKDVQIEGQNFKVKELIVDPIRTVVKIEENPNNTKKLLARPFDELELIDEKGRKWSAIPGNAYKTLEEGNFWEVPLKESFYFHEPKNLTLTFGKIAAMDKEEAYILIDTGSKKFIEKPAQSIFSNLQVKDNRVSFTINIDKDYDMNMVGFIKFTDADEKEFYIHYGGRTPLYSNYVKGSKINFLGEVKIEFELPDKSVTPFANPIRLDLDFYPSWIEEDVEIEVK
ncbi:DUF4179 domain-containing protein [Psychrobacillus sp. INOP01]|uniref:DUF4179 domain-containing protein n=1 Tax=Psychrobacillus sp. INOP01 TaxID=2829187 RepID=UPI001BAB8A14|nr:DUF4179 domain-containing protein [Psychrobacillus sp. INOP01]QUG40152.1 DUF4179 domain-containing protein [Psychrobacillus sp. INOP01]